MSTFLEVLTDVSKETRLYWSNGLLSSEDIGKASQFKRVITRSKTHCSQSSLEQAAALDLVRHSLPSEVFQPGGALDKWNTAFALQIPDYHCEVHCVSGVRHYRNSEGVEYVKPSRTFAFSINSRDSKGIVDVCGGCGSADDLFREMNEAVRALNARRRIATLARELSPRPADDSMLLLGPQAAAVLFHEIYAHGFECGIFSKGAVVGPLSLEISTFGAATTYDDEGVVSGRTVALVECGIATHALYDRASRQPPSGLARCGWHRGPARVRCSDMTVQFRGPGCDPFALQGNLISSDYCAGGCFNGREAKIQLRHVLAYRNGTLIGAVPDICCSFRADSFAKYIVCHCSATVNGRVGRCCKWGDPLPSQIDAPAVLFTGYGVELIG